MLEAIGIERNRFKLISADATSISVDNIWSVDDRQAERYVVCCEVLEHVDHPEQILNAVQQLIGQNGRAFLTTGGAHITLAFRSNQTLMSQRLNFFT